MKTFLGALLIAALACSSQAKVRTETVEYKQGDTVLKGFFAYDDATGAKRPGVLVVHEWWGLNDYARMRATKLAEAGYVALAIDMFGEGKTTEHPQEAGEWAQTVMQNQEVAAARFAAGQKVLSDHKLTAPGQIAAVGYCFGGATVLSMALKGADLKGVVSFHGSLPGDPAPGPVKAKVLVCHGGSDGFIAPEQIQTFQKNLAAAGADWQFIAYGGAKHAFTVREADQRGIPGLAYNEAADRRSWQAMLAFLGEIFAK